MNYSGGLYASHVLERPPSRIRRRRLGGGQEAGLLFAIMPSIANYNITDFRVVH